ncbi:MAG TPA: protein phosphatase 2C domain-containing protein [Dictyobacter sp.]|jgi:serine/threonine protein phosphatase PrpC|nr:protein phosphatase 2C domain-containing protein [Dictyobacter sp.]
MLCPLCHTQNRDNAKFCKGCGQSLVVEVVASEHPDAVASQHAETEYPSVPQFVETTVPEPEQNAATPSASSSGTEVSEQKEESETEQAESEAEHGSVFVASEEKPDVSFVYTNPTSGANQDPTQVLTPEQQEEYQARRRWNEEHWQSSYGHQYAGDIAEAPTIMMPPFSEEKFAQETTPSMDATELSPAVDEQPTVAAWSIDDLPTVPVVEDVAEQETVAAEDVLAQSKTEDTMTDEQHDISEETPVYDQNMDVQPTADEQVPTATTESEQQIESVPSLEESEATSAEFPTLEPDALVAGRYRVAQVLQQAEIEHIYEVVDTQGYRHCWNCASEENAEGDEFCIDCGAALNATYTMHEYAANAGQDGETQVSLQGGIVDTLLDNGHTYVIVHEQVEQSSFPLGVHLVASSSSDAGDLRRGDPNEDSTLVLLQERVHESISTSVGLFVVADGMGGHANGQGASRLTISTIAERVMRELIFPPFEAEKAGNDVPQFEQEQIKSLLQEAVEEANTALCQVNQRDRSDMGSTLTGFMIVGDHAYIFNVGDSRTYMLREEKLYQLTNDHSLVGQLVAGGLIEPEDVYTHPQRNQIFRSIGDKQNVQVDLFIQQIHPGDILLSCSDGLWEMVRDPQITDILNQAPDPQTACAHFIEAANQNGGEDNVSAVVVYVR